ncbi:cohesin domain-containing protein, partial [Candidatus Marithioploca araucensis]|nr:cohesin domain-containing protein [Candidatus Marithioploca araucensis]
FQQDVVLNRYLSGRCDAYSTKSRQEGDTWVSFANNHPLNYQGLLELSLYARNHRKGGIFPKCYSCTVTATATFFGEATNRQEVHEADSFSIPIIRGKQELKRIPLPISQIDGGIVRDINCQATSDKPSEVELFCEQEGDELVVYAELIEAIELVAVSNPSPLCAGESFDITLKTTPESQLVDGIEFSLKFDPTKLQANTIKNSGAFDDVLTEDINVGSIDFAAGVWDNNIPGGEFEVVTFNFTALAPIDGTDLQFDLENSNASFKGKTLLIADDDETIVIQECMGCKVTLQGRPAIPPANSRWETDLRIYVGDKTPYTIKTDGLGHCILPEPSGNYSICVKGPHTLANRIGPPLMLGGSKFLDFGTLLEGDVDDDNDVDLTDRSFIKTSKDKCQGDNGYIENADLDEDDCVKKADYNLWKANYKKPKGNEPPAICEWDTSVTPPTLRRSLRDGGGSVSLRTTPIPGGVTVDSSFDVAIQVDASQAVDAVAAYLNFDPQKLRVNHLTKGDRFDDTLENDFDNVTGHINFVAGAWENDLATGEFTLVTINLTLLDEGGEKTLSFNRTEPRNTEAVGGGESVLAPGQEGSEIIFDDDDDIIAPASCQLYAVNDKGLNNSQFFTVNFFDLTISELGHMHKGYDIESLAIHPETNMIYAASGDNVTNGKPGHFYRVDGENGELFPVGSSGFKEIEDLA